MISLSYRRAGRCMLIWQRKVPGHFKSWARMRMVERPNLSPEGIDGGEGPGGDGPGEAGSAKEIRGQSS